MSDEELTALAAKAFGNAQHGFSPLTDDGDALRLAVKCFLVIDIGPVSVSVHENNGRHDIGFEWRGDDPNAATRRAIVRAAAALSESP